MKKPRIPYVEGNDQGRRTGWPPGMLQDDSRELSKWLSQPTRAHRVFRDTEPEDDGVPDEEKHSAAVLVWMVGAASVGLVAFVVGKAVGLW